MDEGWNNIEFLYNALEEKDPEAPKEEMHYEDSPEKQHHLKAPSKILAHQESLREASKEKTAPNSAAGTTPKQ